MTPQDQQIALCEWMGWKPVVRQGIYSSAWTEWESPNSNDSVQLHQLPDTNSLDVLHEMEMKLTLAQRVDYSNNLAKVCGTEKEKIYATAPQRREALLKTLGL